MRKILLFLMSLIMLSTSAQLPSNVGGMIMGETMYEDIPSAVMSACNREAKSVVTQSGENVYFISDIPFEGINWQDAMAVFYRQQLCLVSLLIENQGPEILDSFLVLKSTFDDKYPQYIMSDEDLNPIYSDGKTLISFELEPQNNDKYQLNAFIVNSELYNQYTKNPELRSAEPEDPEIAARVPNYNLFPCTYYTLSDAVVNGETYCLGYDKYVIDSFRNKQFGGNMYLVHATGTKECISLAGLYKWTSGEWELVPLSPKIKISYEGYNITHISGTNGYQKYFNLSPLPALRVSKEPDKNIVIVEIGTKKYKYDVDKEKWQ